METAIIVAVTLISYSIITGATRYFLLSKVIKELKMAGEMIIK